MPPERLSSLVHRIVSPLHSRSNSTHSQEKLAHSSQDKINNHEKPASPSPASPASPLASPVDRESPLRNSQQFGSPSRSSSSTGGGTPASGTVSPPNGVKRVEHIRSARASTDSGFASGGNGMRYDKTKRRLYEEEKIEQRRRSEEEQLRAGLDEETRARYGDLEKPQELTTIQDISSLPAGAHVAFRARIFTQRRVSKSLDFLLFREQTFSIQGVLANAPPQMIKWTQRLHPESIVQVTGTLKEPKTPVTSATCQDREVDIFSIHLVNSARNLAFNNYMPPEALHQRMQARVVDLRHPSNQALFRIRAAVARTFRAELDAKGFMEIQTPKLQPAATESGAEVFKVNYFGRRAFLAQSPQLAKQMAISADFGRVYEVGPVFRAENSNTHRHLTEYTGLDLEMSLQKSYTELIQVVDSTIKAILKTITSMPEVQIVRQRWPSTDLVWLDETPVIPFREGVQMLRDDGREVEEEDLSTRDEIRLGELVKAKYKTDYYILDKFPANARPFYTHKAADPKWTNSFDVFLRGQEIGTGGQRIHVLETLRKSMMEAGIAEDGMEDYISAFQAGAPPHGGVGLGLERILTFGLELGDIRFASPFHRDTKSLPERPPSLPHPDADTLKPRDPDAELPPVEKLIANYGDATNTSWLDERFEIWRHQPTGAAIGFARQDNKFVMITGDPLCDQRQYAPIIDEFLHYVHDELKLKPVWMIVSEEVQEVLARKHGWRTLTCIEEQRLNTENENIPPPHRDRAARRVEREGISIHEVRPDEQFVPRADRAIESWKAHRKGKQVHLTEVRPWVDPEHRRYFAAERDKEVLGLVVLARLAPRHGWQVKWALNFPAAPNGTIEQLIEHALSAVPGPITFGAGVSENLTPKAHIDGVRARALARTYKTIVHSLRINRKAQFREKFGVVGEAMYICYPRHGLGLADLRQIVKFFED